MRPRPRTARRSEAALRGCLRFAFPRRVAASRRAGAPRAPAAVGRRRWGRLVGICPKPARFPRGSLDSARRGSRVTQPSSRKERIKMAQVKAIPEGYTTITPMFMFRDTKKAIEFYKKAFGAKEQHKMLGPDGNVLHAELVIGSSIIMVGDEAMGYKSAESIGDSPVRFYVYVDNVDAAFQQALAAGGKQINGVADMFWGDRVGQFQDPYGYRWSLATHVKDLSPKDMEAAMEEWLRQTAEAK